MIRTIELSRVFRTDEVETTALNKVNFEVTKGEFVAVMGPSGCGKSTLLNIIGFIDEPTDGSYYFEGMDVTRLRESQRTVMRRENIGFIFQSFYLIDAFNVFENVELPLIYMRVRESLRKSGWKAYWKALRLATGSIITRSSFQADSSNVWPLPGPWLLNRSLSWPMSLRAISIQRMEWRS